MINAEGQSDVHIDTCSEAASIIHSRHSCKTGRYHVGGTWLTGGWIREGRMHLLTLHVEDDLPVCRVCSHSTAGLSAGQLSLLRFAPVSYPVSGGQEMSQHISEVCHNPSYSSCLLDVMRFWAFEDFRLCQLHQKSMQHICLAEMF